MNHYYNVLSRVFAVTGILMLALSAAGQALCANEAGANRYSIAACAPIPGMGICGGSSGCTSPATCQVGKTPVTGGPTGVTCCY